MRVVTLVVVSFTAVAQIYIGFALKIFRDRLKNMRDVLISRGMWV